MCHFSQFGIAFLLSGCLYRNGCYCAKREVVMWVPFNKTGQGNRARIPSNKQIDQHHSGQSTYSDNGFHH